MVQRSANLGPLVLLKNARRLILTLMGKFQFWRIRKCEEYGTFFFHSIYHNQWSHPFAVIHLENENGGIHQ